MSENMSIKFEKGEYNIGALSIAEIKVGPIAFVAYGNIVEPIILTMENQRDRNKEVVRAMMKARCTAFGTDGKMYKLTDEAISALPIKKAVDLKLMLNEDTGVAGEILNDADGVSAPILYKLGTPLKDSKGVFASELEFQAKRYGDIEDVLACPYTYSQTAALIEKCSMTVGEKSMVLPSWALDQISVEDGLKISEILPRFFG